VSAPPRPSLDASELERLYARSDARAAFYLLSIALALGLALALASCGKGGIVAAIVLVGALQHHLSIVHHEANHFLLFRGRLWNEAVGALAGYAVGFTMAYRSIHLEHHRLLGQDGDPDAENYVRYPLSRLGLAGSVLWNLSGLATARQFLRQTVLRPRSAPGAKASSWKELPLLVLTQAAIAAGFWAAGGFELYLLLWVLPLVTIAKTLAQLRNIAEHTLLRDNGDPELSRYRTIRVGWIEWFFFAPMNFNFHAEHHLYPGIPFHHLPGAHRLLAARPEYARAVCLHDGYLSFLLTRAVR
jgi:fatty acid desaturase